MKTLAQHIPPGRAPVVSLPRGRRVLAALLPTTMATTLAALTVWTAVGTSPLSAAQPIAKFLKLSGSSRIDAMGGAYTAVGGRADAVTINPAGLYGVQRLSTYFTYFELPEGANHYRGFLGDTFDFGTMGFGVSGISSGVIEETTATSTGDVTKTGNTFGISGQAFGLTYANNFFADVATGFTLKLVREDFSVATSTTVALDAGLQSFFFKRRFMAGFSVLNAGPPVQREDGSGQSDIPPLTARLGIGYMALAEKEHTITVLTDAGYSIDEQFQLHIGLEYEFARMASVRVGYYPQSTSEDFAIGVGFKTLLNQTNYGVDYSMKNTTTSGLTNQVTVQASWEPTTARKINNPYVRVELTDGSVMVGKILDQDDKKIEIDILGQGRTVVQRTKIKEMTRLNDE